MKLKSVSVGAVLDDWKSDQEYEQDISPNLLKKWANDAATRMITDEQYVHKIALLNVFDYRAHLPEDYKFVVQAGYRAKAKGCVRREQLVQWTKSTMDGSGCKFTIDLECPSCHKSDCSCDGTITTIDVNHLWSTAHPETHVAYMKHFFGFGGNTQLYGQFGEDGFFKIMRPAQSNFFNSDAFLSGCGGVSIDNIIEYKVQPPNIIVNFQEGQILLSYMGVQYDDDGWVLIPDHPDVFDAISFSIDEKLARRDYRKRKDSASRIYWSDMTQRKEQLVARARGKLQIPDADEWAAMMRNHFNKLKPYWHHERNFDRMQPDGYRQPGETYNI